MQVTSTEQQVSSCGIVLPMQRGVGPSPDLVVSQALPFHKPQPPSEHTPKTSSNQDEFGREHPPTLISPVGLERTKMGVQAHLHQGKILPSLSQQQPNNRALGVQAPRQELGA